MNVKEIMDQKLEHQQFKVSIYYTDFSSLRLRKIHNTKRETTMFYKSRLFLVISIAKRTPHAHMDLPRTAHLNGTTFLET